MQNGANYELLIKNNEHYHGGEKGSWRTFQKFEKQAGKNSCWHKSAIWDISGESSQRFMCDW